MEKAWERLCIKTRGAAETFDIHTLAALTHGVGSS